MFLGLFFIFITHRPSAAQQHPAATPSAPRTAVRVFLDCNRCDEAFLKREVTFIDYVRNREDADVHVLVTTQRTGSGGTQFVLQFIGQGAFRGVDQSLTYSASQTATSDEIRAGFAQMFTLGLVRYAAESTLADRLHVTVDAPAGEPLRPIEEDRWNYWVFRASGGGNFSGEETSSSKSVNGSLRATRTTERWRHAFSATANYRESRFQVDDEEEGPSTVRSVRRDMGVDGLVVKSLTEHWSAGLAGFGNASTFRNYDLRVRIAPGVEYDFFPYLQSSRRMLTLQYTIGFDWNDYKEETVFGKLTERLIDHRLELGLGLRQPWGSAAAEVNYSQFLSDPPKYSIGAEGNLNVRLFKGFSFNVSGEVSRPRDQIYLPRGVATTEEILLRQRQLATNYSYFLGFGVSYSFGSIFNNIVNPRFGGAGGF